MSSSENLKEKRKLKRKITDNAYGVLHCHQHYRKLLKYYNRKGVDIATYRKILREINEGIRNLLIYEGERVYLAGCGEFWVKKYKRFFDPKQRFKWPINWAETKRTGHHQFYFDQPYVYKIICLPRNNFYWFLPAKDTSRLLAKAILKDKKDYF